VTNQYVSEGVSGGLLTLLLFLGILVFSFRGVGRLLVQAGQGSDRQKHLWIAWGLGVVIFVHASAFVAVSYFGQIIMLWYLALAMVGSLAPRRTRMSRIGLPSLRYQVVPVSSSLAVPVRRLPAPPRRMVLSRVPSSPVSSIGERVELRRLNDRLESLEGVIERLAAAMENQNDLRTPKVDDRSEQAGE